VIVNVPDIDDHEQLAANREEMIVELWAWLNVFRASLRTPVVPTSGRP